MTKGTPKSIVFGTESSGIKIDYIKNRNVLYIGGWYDHFVGIESHEISFGEFCEKLGIELKGSDAKCLKTSLKGAKSETKNQSQKLTEAN